MTFCRRWRSVVYLLRVSFHQKEKNRIGNGIPHYEKRTGLWHYVGWCDWDNSPSNNGNPCKGQRQQQSVGCPQCGPAAVWDMGGTVLAYYFFRDNYESASTNTIRAVRQLSLEERLRAIPVT